MNEDNLLNLLKKFAAAWNDHDIDTLMQCMTPDNCVFYSAAGASEHGGEFHGPEQVRAAFKAVWEKFPDARWNNPKHFVCGNHGYSEWLFSGSTKDGKEKCLAHGVDLFEFENGKIKIKDTYRKQVLG